MDPLSSLTILGLGRFIRHLWSVGRHMCSLISIARCYRVLRYRKSEQLNFMCIARTSKALRTVSTEQYAPILSKLNAKALISTAAGRGRLSRRVVRNEEWSPEMAYSLRGFFRREFISRFMPSFFVLLPRELASPVISSWEFDRCSREVRGVRRKPFAFGRSDQKKWR